MYSLFTRRIFRWQNYFVGKTIFARTVFAGMKTDDSISLGKTANTTRKCHINRLFSSFYF